MVEVEQRPLRALEEHRLAVLERPIDEQRRVRDIWAQPLRIALVALCELLELERLDAVDALEPHVLLLERDLDLLAEDLRVEEILDADAKPVALSAYAGPMPRRVVPIWSFPSRRSLAWSSATCHGMTMCAFRRQAHDVDGDAPAARSSSSSMKTAGSTTQPEPMHALLAPENPRGHVLELVRLAVGDDRVAGVGPALVAADDVRVAGEQVDDLALALVSPLRADDYRRGHAGSLTAERCCSEPRSLSGLATYGSRRERVGSGAPGFDAHASR